MAEQKHVLVVDDDASVREMLSTAFRLHALEVDVAANGREALDLLRERRYTVIVLDLIMPVLDGFGVLEGMDGLEDSPVVLVLSGADRRMLERLDARRIHGVVRKPFDPEELASLVVACAEIKGRSPFETMAMAMLAGGPILAWLSVKL
ncbi:MAG TPA: response regulator [Thermoanaerobaculia bacterium]|jgi:two-component system OmpR family response regulator|nr:response regulator [Thermoanaerobaculia bacterium]